MNAARVVYDILTPIAAVVVSGAFYWLWRQIRNTLTAGQVAIMNELAILSAGRQQDREDIMALNTDVLFLKGQMDAVLKIGAGKPLSSLHQPEKGC